jgi:hypothetical protein
MATPADICKANEAQGEVWEMEMGTEDQRGTRMAT